MHDFIPPINSPLMVRVTNLILPLVQQLNGIEVHATPRCRKLIKELGRRHAVLMVNHSDRFDPLCVFALRSVCNESFNFMASREQFDQKFGLAGWLMQNLGVYSVIRGREIDVASADKTVSILVQGNHKLVEFPEGDVTGRDDAILPLKVDGIHNLLKAQQRLSDLTDESLFVVPIAIYYEVRHDSVKAMNAGLRHLEQLLNVPRFETEVEVSFEQKIKRLVSKFIEHLANYYQARQVNRESLSAQLRELSKYITIMTAQGNGIQFDRNESEDVLLYGVRADLQKLPSDICNDAQCSYKDRLTKAAKKQKPLFTKHLDRAEQLLILASTLENRQFTPEVAWRVLDRLELELTGKATPKGHRTAWIDASGVIDLKPIYEHCGANEREAIAKVDASVRVELSELMKNMQKRAKRDIVVQPAGV